MKMEVANKSSYYLSLSALAATMILMIYAAHPWGNNYAYGGLSGYLGLLGFLCWAASPYILLAWRSKRTIENSKKRILFETISILMCTISLALIIDIIFIHPDPQGGIALLFLPIYQWLIIGVYGFVTLLI